MDHARLIIAIALSFLVFLLWDFFFVSKKRVEQPKKTLQVEKEKKEELFVQKKENAKVAKTPLPKQVSLQSSKPARTVTVNLPLYSVKISEKGAVFKSFVLNKYREELDADSSFLEMISSDITDGTDIFFMDISRRS
jgi:YidC/Oxa1 family membrane protein insertase